MIYHFPIPLMFLFSRSSHSDKWKGQAKKSALGMPAIYSELSNIHSNIFTEAT